MYRRFQNLARGAALVALVLGVAACDFSGVNELGDDFDLVIELQPINTVVTGQVVDNATLEPVRDVQLTFSGANGSDIVDVYSDPIAEARVESGVLTFGLDNAVVPTASSPATFVVEAEAEGYFTESAQVTLDEVGSGNVTIRLTPRNVTSEVAGTSGVQSSTVSADANSGVAQDVTISTPQRQGVKAQAAASLSQGARPLAADGTALTGQITTQMRVFDPSEGLEALPRAVKRSDAGGVSNVLGAVYLRMEDQGGNVATRFAASGTSKTAASCRFSLAQEFDDATLYAIVKAGFVERAPVRLTSALTGESVEVGSVPLELGAGNVVRGTVCVGGADENVDLSQAAGMALSKGFFVSIVSRNLPTSTFTHVTVDNTTNASPVRITKLKVEGLGVVQTLAQAFEVAAGASRQVPLGVELPSGLSGNVIAVLETGDRVAHTFDVPAGASFDQTLVLPSVALKSYTVGASISCPAGQKFSPQITERSFSALGLQYKRRGVQMEYVSVGGIDDVSAGESSVSANTSVALVPGVTYVFKAIYGNGGATLEQTAPTSGSSIDLSIDLDDIGGLECR